MENGVATLDDILYVGKKYDCEELIFILRSLIKGFSILQRNGIAHRDIKPLNIILVEEESSNGIHFLYKISDFGISCRLPIGSTTISINTVNGFSDRYVAPEVLELYEKSEKDENFDQEYNPFKGDVYSLGILILNMINYKYDKKFLQANKDFISTLVGYEKLIPILKRMLTENADIRLDLISLDEIFEKEFKKTDISMNPIKDELKYYEKSVEKRKNQKESQ